MRRSNNTVNRTRLRRAGYLCRYPASDAAALDMTYE
jgi:hypothetical protein